VTVLRQRPPAAVVVPIRGFAGGKSRLGSFLDATQRAELLRTMAERVVLAARPLPVAVVSNAAEVRAWAASLRLAILDDPGGLDEAARAGQHWAASLESPRVVIAHADLPLARGLARLAGDRSRPIVAAVPCHRDDGTPVLSLPATVPFVFAYGRGSFRRHAAEARRLGLGFRVVRDRALAYDVDAPEDLGGLQLAGGVGGGRETETSTRLSLQDHPRASALA
jgi:2-phospho-L-lactate/phosphoenolpyruvate guanylyltransferase